ncbi:MAG: hypothetical protein H5T92_00655 [Synergistales bacterium]|nr:hypothetical protein [Synergistales bacterium]
MWLIPPQHVTLDIETIAGDPCEAEAALRRTFSPDSRWKPATIGERYLQALEAKKERLALLDTAPIISVALRTENDCRLLHCMALDEPSIAGVPLERFPDQRSMILRARDYLVSLGPESVIVGHNVKHFDLPKLRLAMLRFGIQLPPCLVWPEQPVYDTMQMWRYFSLDEKPLISLDECLELAGLTSHKSAVTGADVPVLFENKDYRTIAAYAIADVLAQDALYLRMTGQVPDQLPSVESSATGNEAVQPEAAPQSLESVLSELGI